MASDRSIIAEPTPTPRSNALYSAIVATVAARGDQTLTVRDVAERLGTEPDVTARCIALHCYFRTHADDRLQSGTMELPPPAELAIPAPDDVVDEARLGLS